MRPNQTRPCFRTCWLILGCCIMT